MENVLQWGLDLIRLIQSHANTPLNGVMKGITQLGSSTAYMILIPLIYWCIDEKKGFKLGLVIMLSAWLNVTLKFIFDQPRPFFPGYDPSLGIITEKLGGLPSGHAQNALVMWIIIASWVKRKWAYIAAALVCLAVSFSRVYLGVHFPTDILAGWILGGVALCVYFLLGGKIESLLLKGGQRVQMICIAAVSFLMLLYRPTGHADDFIMLSAIFLGLGGGYLLSKRYVKFTSALPASGKRAAKFLRLCVRFVLGLTVTVLIFVVFRKLTPADRNTSYFMIIYFVRYALIGLWAGVGAPWLFCLLRLAEKRAAAE